MAITPVTTLTVAKKGELFSPPVGTQPLTAILNNLHYLWQKHQPPLLSVVYNASATTTRSTIYHIPITPSADGLLYTFAHRFICSAATQTVAVTVEETDTYAGGGTAWTAIYTQNVVTGGAGLLTTSTSASYAIPADAVAIRVTLAAPGAGTKTDHHLLVYPSPAAPTAGTYASGFKPFDDGIMASANLAPIHEEWIQRAARSSRALAQDRKQCVYAFVQEYRSAPVFSCRDALYGNTDAGYSLPTVRAYLPHASTGQSVSFSVIAEVSAGATADLITVAGTILDAVGTVVSGDTITLDPKSSGTGAYIDIPLVVRNTTGNSTRVFAVIGRWTPKQPTDDLLSWQLNKWPPAQAWLLSGAADRVEGVALGPYAGTAHLYNGVSIGLSQRYLGAMVAPGAVKARLTVAQGWNQTDAVGAWPTKVIGATGGAVHVQLAWVGPGREPAFGLLGCQSALVTSSDGDLSATGDGTLSLTTANAPAVEALAIENSVGFSLWFSRQLEDLEIL